VGAQSNEELKEEANKMFENEQYVEATKSFLHLLSLNPTDVDLNFKYGACLLYNSNQKNKALRYLNFAVTVENVDPRAFYFRAKGLHFNYQFDDARKSYVEYQKLTQGKTDKRYEVQRQIEMCDNGKKLLSTFTDIIVADKKEIDQSKFFRIYSDSKTIGGAILVTEEFQSKLDKKMNHIPIVHFPPNAKAIYYSSYGESLDSGKDIYVRRRLPNNKWGEPQKVPGSVNTNSDEDFPYLHPSGKILYFSSKGHNSMGGYDVFMSELSPDVFSFGTPENVDFAISSPDDDLFYVVDSLFENAYFASARQSQDGKLHVYKVKVARVPIQDVIVMGDYLSEISPNDKSIQIDFKAVSNGAKAGAVATNKAGKYSFVFPKGGKYEYIIKLDGDETEYKFEVELPFLDEFRPLKQRIVHRMENGEEVVRIYNLFDEKVEGGDELIAEVIRKKSALEINIDKFDLKELNTGSETKEILANLGFNNMSIVEVNDKVNELISGAKDNSNIAAKIDANLATELSVKADRIVTLNTVQNELVNKAAKTNDPVLKHKLLTEAHQKEVQKLSLIDEVEMLTETRSEVTTKLNIPTDKIDELIEIQEAFNALVENKEDLAALKLLNENKSVLDNVKSGTQEEMIQNIVRQNVELSNEITKEKDKIASYEKTNVLLNREIVELSSQLETSNKKKYEELKLQIESKESEKKLVDEEITAIQSKINELNLEKSTNDKKISSIQKASDNSINSVVDAKVLDEKMKAAMSVKSEVETTNIQEEIAKIEAENPAEFGSGADMFVAVTIKDNEAAKSKIQKNTNLTDIEKLYRLQDANNATISEVELELNATIDELENDPLNNQLKEEKAKLEELKNRLVSENLSLTKEAEGLKTNSPDIALSKDDVIAEIDNSYSENIAKIQLNESLTELDKRKQALSVNESFTKKLSETKTDLEKDIEKDPTDEEAIAKLTIVKDVLEETENSIEALESEIIKLNPVVAEVKTADENSVINDYQKQIDVIKEDNSLTALESSTQLQKVDESLLKSVGEEIKSIDKKLNKNPNDESLIERKIALTQLNEKIENNVAERNQLISSLNETNKPEVIAGSDVKSDVLNSIAPSYLSDKETLLNGNQEENSKIKELLALEETYISKLDEAIKKNADNSEKLKVLNELLLDAKSSVASLIKKSTDILTTEEKSDLINQVDKKYTAEIEKLKNSNASNAQLIDRENELLTNINSEIDRLQESNKRKWSVGTDLSLMKFEKIKLETEERIDSLNEASVTNTKEIAFVNSLRETYLDQNADLFENESKDINELKSQEMLLSAYEEVLNQQIEGLANATSQQEKDELSWLENEKSEVQDKRRRIKIGIGELDTLAVTENSVANENAFEQLKIEEQLLNEQLNNPSITSAERKEVKKAIETNLNQQNVEENKLLQESLTIDAEKTSELITQLKLDGNSNELTINTIEEIQNKESVLNETINAAQKAKTEEEKNFLLKEAEGQRLKINSDAETILAEIKVNDIEKSEGVSVYSKEELEKKKRSFRISIGELMREISEKDKEISKAKKKEVASLVLEKEQLELELKNIESRLAIVNEQLEAYQDRSPVTSNLALKETITFNEERAIASTEEYEKYEKIASEALQVESKLTNLEIELINEQRILRDLVQSTSEDNNEDVSKSITKIKTLQEQIDRVKIDLVQKKWLADEMLPKNEEEAMKMQNLVSRGIKPIQLAVVATALIQLPSDGLAITTESKSIYSDENPIPVGVSEPSGLIYRVQIGAFGKPIPQDLFSEFNPVSGEKIPNTNITRYMAGYFNNSDAVVDARGKIRELGYNDAFVVAYCDGERIGFAEARRREEAGTCVPKGNNEIMMEVAVNTAEKLGVPLATELEVVSETDYNKAPGAVPADPIETMQGLFFTVQIGVFNRPVGPENLFNMTEINTIRLPNGQIRYSSGVFDDMTEALVRRNIALKNGVQGAFVTAYFKGKRISLSEANRILELEGRTVLQSNMTAPVQKEPIKEVVKKDSVKVNQVNIVADADLINQQRVQVVTKKTFDYYPRDILNRYNAEGNFYYDVKDKKVKSVVYKNEDYLPRLYNFRDDIDTIYFSVDVLDDEIEKIVAVNFSDSTISGDFMDWLLRYNYRRTYLKNENGTEVRIFGVDEVEIEPLLEIIRNFGLNPQLIEETELELELNEESN